MKKDNGDCGCGRILAVVTVLSTTVAVGWWIALEFVLYGVSR